LSWWMSGRRSSKRGRASAGDGVGESWLESRR
jgi:hypothetical protein